MSEIWLFAKDLLRIEFYELIGPLSFEISLSISVLDFRGASVKANDVH